MAEEEDVAVLVDVEVDVRDRVGVAEGQSCCWFMTSSPMGPSSKDPSFMDSATQATEGSHTPISGLAVPLAYVARARGMLENPITDISRCLKVGLGPICVALPLT